MFEGRTVLIRLKSKYGKKKWITFKKAEKLVNVKVKLTLPLLNMNNTLRFLRSPAESNVVFGFTFFEL